jgi:hypothetical protein
MAQAPGTAMFYRQYVTPLLAEHGFVGRGRTFRRRAGNGDTAVVNFQTSSSASPASYLFYVNLALVVTPWLDWKDGGAVDPTAFEPTHVQGLFSVRVRQLRGWSDRWSFDSIDTAHECGQELTEALGPRLEELVSLLDRSEFLRRIRQGPQLQVGQSPKVMEVVLLVDDGLTEDLTRLLDEIAEGPGAAFADWARKRAQSRVAG